MGHPNGRKPPNPTRLPQQHGRRPSPPPAHSSRGKSGCALELTAAVTALVVLVLVAIL